MWGLEVEGASDELPGNVTVISVVLIDDKHVQKDNNNNRRRCKY